MQIYFTHTQSKIHVNYERDILIMLQGLSKPYYGQCLMALPMTRLNIHRNPTKDEICSEIKPGNLDSSKHTTQKCASPYFFYYLLEIHELPLGKYIKN